MRRRDHVHLVVSCCFQDFFFHAHSARDNQYLHAFTNGEVLDVRAVAHHHHQLLSWIPLKPLSKRLETHPSNRQDQLALLFSVVPQEQLTSERLGKAFQRSQETARIKQPVRHREEEFAQLEKRHETA